MNATTRPVRSRRDSRVPARRGERSKGIIALLVGVAYGSVMLLYALSVLGQTHVDPAWTRLVMGRLPERTESQVLLYSPLFLGALFAGGAALRLAKHGRRGEAKAIMIFGAVATLAYYFAGITRAVMAMP